jgi:hypothetical protein
MTTTILDVPQIKQSNTSTCGAVALKMVLDYWKCFVEEEVIWNS